MAKGKLIDPTKFPLKSSDLDINSMQGAGESLGTAGTVMVTAMDDISASWSRLPGVYVAPEGDLVYRLMTPAVTATSEVNEKFSRAYGFCDLYVQVLRGVKRDLEDVEARAAVFRADVKDGVSILRSQKEWASPHMSEQARQDFQTARIDVDWREDETTNAKNTALLAEYDAICVRVLQASAECTESLRGLLSAEGRVGLLPPLGGPGAVAYDYAPVSMDQPAWGYPGDTDRSVCESVSHGMINFGRDTINGVGGLVGFNLDHIGSGDLLRGEVFGQSWAGLGNLAGSLIVTSTVPVQIINASMKGDGKGKAFTDWMDDRNTVVYDTGAAILGYDPHAEDSWHQWKEDPAAMATETGLNVLTCLVPGADVAAGLKAGTWAARAARLAGEAADVAIPGGSQLVKGGLTIMRGADEAAEATRVSLGAGAARGGLLQITIHTTDITIPAHQPPVTSSIRPPHIDNPSITPHSRVDLSVPGAARPHAIQAPHGVETPAREPALADARPGEINNSVGTTPPHTGTGGHIQPRPHPSTGGGNTHATTGSGGGRTPSSGGHGEAPEPHDGTDPSGHDKSYADGSESHQTPDPNAQAPATPPPPTPTPPPVAPITPEQYDAYVAKLGTRGASYGSPGARAFQQSVTGSPLEYSIRSGNIDIWADGLKYDPGSGGAVLEAKFIERPGRSSIYEGTAPDFVMNKPMADFEDEIRRYAQVIADSTNPLSRLEVVVSTPAAQVFVSGKMAQFAAAIQSDYGIVLNYLVRVGP